MPSYSRQVPVPGRSSQELYDKVAAQIDHFLEKAQVGKADVKRDPSGKKLLIESSMFSATLKCKDNCIEVDGKLSLLAAPFRSKIDEGIDKWIARAFGSKA